MSLRLDRYESRDGVMVPKALGYDVVMPNPNRKQVGISTWTMPVDEDRLVGSWDLTRIRMECNHAVRNRPSARAIHDRLIDGVVGTEGIRPEAATSDDKWNKLADDYITEAAKIMDYRQRIKSLAEYQGMITHHMITDGALYIILLENGQTQPIEADRVCTPEDMSTDPTVVNGAKVGRGGIILGWYVCDRGPNGFVDRQKYEYVEARDMIVTGNPFRVDQVAPLPMLLPALAKLIDLDEMEQQMLLKAKHEAKRSFAFYSDSATGGAGTVPDRLAGFVTAAGTTNQRGLTYEQVNGLEIYYPTTREKLDNLEPKNPGAYHIDYCEQVFGECCAAVGIAPEWVLLKYSTSYIASRGALVSTEPTIQRVQATIEVKFMQRWRNWRLAKAIKNKELPPAPRDARGMSEWYRCYWHAPPMVALDRQKEADADLAEWMAGKSCLDDAQRRIGSNFERTHRKRLNEAIRIVSDAKANGVPLYMLAPTPPNQGKPEPIQSGGNEKE